MPPRFSTIKTMIKKTSQVVLSAVGFFVVSAHIASAQVSTNFDVPLTDASLIDVVINLINIFLGLLSLIAVIMIIYGGTVWLTANGSEEKIEKAKRILRNAVIGLVIILLSWALVTWIIGLIQDASEDGNTAGGGGTSGGSIPTTDSGFYVLATDPEAGEIGASLCAVQVRMSDYVDKNTVTPDNFYLRVDGGAPNGAECSANNACASGLCTEGACVGESVAGQIGFGPGESTKDFNFLPDADLEKTTTYRAVIEGGQDGVLSKDPDDDGIDDRLAMSASYVWSFTTGSEKDETPPTVEVNGNSPFPADEEVNVCTNTVINFDFSEPMLVSSFNDDTSFVLAASGTKAAPVAPDWANPLGLDHWNFGGNFDYAQTRPAETLQPFALYSPRLFGGDAANEFAGAITDYCGNPLDGDADGIAEGSTVDNFYGFDESAGESEEPITWETGENAQCTPVIESISPGYDYYGEDGKLREGDACTENAQCGSGLCSNSKCAGYAPNTMTINGLYLGPHPEVQLQGSVIWASESFNTCFDEQHLGNVQTNTAVGDYCLEDEQQTSAQIQLRTPVGTADSPVRVSVADELSDPSEQSIDVLSPYIHTIDPKDGAIGQYITLSGQNFGAGIGEVVMRSADGSRTSTLTLPQACGEVWSDQEVVVVAPETYTHADGTQGSWQTGDVAYVQLYNPNTDRYSDLQRFEFSDVVRPNLCQVQPQCDSTSNKPFTVTGEGFDDSRGDNQVAFTGESDNLVYNSNIDSWEDTQASGTTNSSMGQQGYWVSIHDAETGLNSNGRSYDIPCNNGPKVVTINQCSQEEGIYPVPNPQPNEKAACINSTVGILFDQQLNTDTLTPQNVFLQQFNSGDELDGSYRAIPVEGQFQTKNWSYNYNGDTYYGFQYNITRTFADRDQNGVADGGDTSPYLQPNTWYQLTINNAVTNKEGVGMANTYSMRFKTKDTTEACALDNINLAPSRSVQNSYWDYEQEDVAHESFTGSAYDAQCQLLDADSYSWNWLIENNQIGNFGTGPGKTANQNVYVAGDEQKNEGTTTVTTSVGDEQDDSDFKVDLAFCESDADCSQCTHDGQTSTCNLETNRCTPVVKNFTPADGDNGTWATINGCMFGTPKGNVFWNGQDGSEPLETAWPNEDQCGVTWKDTQIIAQVPDGATEQGYGLTVETKYGDRDDASSAFTVNQTLHPGLCKIDPDTASEHDQVKAVGQSLGDQEGFASFLTDDDYEPPVGPDRVSGTAEDTEWNEVNVITRVPTGAITGRSEAGKVGFMAITAGGDEQCQNTQFCSGGLDFNVSCKNDYDCNSGCCSESGNCMEAEFCMEQEICTTNADCQVNGCSDSQCNAGKCTPDIKELYNPSGPPGSPVTIYGCYFGSYASGKSAVNFDAQAAELMCSDGWSDTTIIAKVPENLSFDTEAHVTVTTKSGLSTSASDEQAIFTVTQQCYDGGAVPPDGVPLLCDLSPGTGDASAEGAANGTDVTFYGDRYVAQGQKNVFADNKTGDAFSYSSATKTAASVPYQATTGPAAAEVVQCRGNGIEFGVQCQTAADCQSGAYCVEGICSEYSCGACTSGTSDAVCGVSNGCSANPEGQYCCAPRPRFVSADPSSGQSNICPNRTLSLVFSEEMSNYTSQITIEEVVYNDDHSIKTATPVSGQFTSDDKKTITVVPSAGWKTATNYRVTVRSNPDNETGVVSASNSLAMQDGDRVIEFSTATNECQPAFVELKSDETGDSSYTFTAPNSRTTFTATMYASDHQPLEPTKTMAWEYTWGPYYDEDSCNKIAWVDLTAETDGQDQPSATSETQTIISGTENNEQGAITVTASPTEGSSWSGELYASAPVFVYFCNPDELWEYENTDSSDSLRQNFRLLYCASEGLPQLPEEPAITPGTDSTYLRQYLFTNPDNKDQAFGVRVYKNPDFLTISEWYAKNVPNAGSPSSTTIDGYNALRDGSSYYIAASNIIGSELYNNIYLITFNEEAKTQEIAKQIIDNFRLNLNVDYAQCEGSDKNKLTRDTNRINDLYTIARLAEQYHSDNGSYPLPKSSSYGSYIDVLTTSVWPSWQGALGNQLGQSLPTDPYNFYYASDTNTPWEASSTPWIYEGEGEVRDCKNEPDKSIYFDEAGTCWDPINSEFFCPKNSYTYMWKSIRSNPNNRNQIDSAKIYAKFEYTSDTTEEYVNMSPNTDACDDVLNAECSCYNYSLGLGG